MRVALCQLPVSPDPSVNLSRAGAALKEAAAGGAELAVFPEATMVRFGSDLRAAAEALDGPFCAGLAAACASTGVALVAGVFEPAPDGRVFNTAVAFSSSGALIAAYRKLHLFDALGQRESDLVAPGSSVVVTSLAGVPVGLQVCYDIRFPELSRALAGSDEIMWGEEDSKSSAYLTDHLPLSRQAGQAGRFAKYLNSLPGDLIVMGDFNSAPWGRVQHAFRAKTGLDNQAGWDFSWPSWLYRPLRLPLDHVLTRGHLVVTAFSAGPETDSDHLPVIAEIGWRD